MDPFPQEAWGKRACAIIGAFNGSEEDGKKALAPLLDKLPEPFFNWMSVMPFPAMQGLFDPFFPKGLQWYWKGDFVNGPAPTRRSTPISPSRPRRRASCA